MAEDLIGQGLELMLFGMGTVVVFLTLLVFATGAMSALIQRYAPEPLPSVESGAGQVAAVTDPVLLAVISAAIQKHRSRS